MEWDTEKRASHYAGAEPNHFPFLSLAPDTSCRGYDMSGSASLDSVLMANANVPEPFALNDAYEGTNLRSGH